MLQNQLKKKLPAAFTAQFPQGLEIAFAAIPVIKDLSEPLRSEVRQAFAQSMRTVWLVMVGISGAGLLTMALMKEVPMQAESDERFGLESKGPKGDLEKTDVATVVAVATAGKDDGSESNERVSPVTLPVLPS